MISLTKKQGTIVAAMGVAIVLVGGAYYLSSDHFSPNSLSAESTDELLKTYAAKDTDADGLPDWQEALYKTDPQNPHSVRADLTDGEAVAQKLVEPQAPAPSGSVSSNILASIPGETPAPGSVTEKFALAFFESYVKDGGGAVESPESLQAFVEGAVADLEKNQEYTDAYGAADAVVDASVSLASYAANAEGVFASDGSAPASGELVYFSDAVLRNDSVALGKVEKIGNTYAAMAERLIKIRVPEEARIAHIGLANALARLGNTIGDMAALKSDPVRAMLGFGNYERDTAGFARALGSMNAVLVAGKVSPAPGVAGYGFVSMTAYGKALSDMQP